MSLSPSSATSRTMIWRRAELLWQILLPSGENPTLLARVKHDRDGEPREAGRGDAPRLTIPAGCSQLASKRAQALNNEPANLR